MEIPPLTGVRGKYKNNVIASIKKKKIGKSGKPRLKQSISNMIIVDKINPLVQVKRNIAVPVSQVYLQVALKGFCHMFDLAIEELHRDPAVFWKVLKTKKPKLVFIDLPQMIEIVRSFELSANRSFLQEEEICLCGIGDWPVDQLPIQTKSMFKKVFDKPLNIDDTILFLSDNLFKLYERRTGDRRRLHDRRANGVNLQKTYKTAIKIDDSNKKIIVNGEAFETTPKELLLLDLLIKNRGTVIASEEILKKVWSKHSHATKSDVHQYIYLLRKKIEKDPQKPKLLITVKGFGYRLSI